MNDAVTLEELEGVPVARLHGEIDIARSVEVRDELMSALSNAHHGLVLDLQRTSYLDSAGLNVVFELAERLSERGQRLAGVMPERAIVRRLVNMVNLAAVMSIHETLEAATAEVRALGEAR